MKCILPLGCHRRDVRHKTERETKRQEKSVVELKGARGYSRQTDFLQKSEMQAE